MATRRFFKILNRDAIASVGGKTRRHSDPEGFSARVIKRIFGIDQAAGLTRGKRGPLQNQNRIFPFDKQPLNRANFLCGCVAK